MALWKGMPAGSLCDTHCFLCMSRLGLTGQVMVRSSPSKGWTWPGQPGKMVPGLPQPQVPWGHGQPRKGLSTVQG